MSIEMQPGSESNEPINIDSEKKRFELGRQEFARERIEMIRESVGEIRQKNPEVLSLTLFGSTVKGGVREKSDIDGCLFVDADIVAKKYGMPVYDLEARNDYAVNLSSPYSNDYREMISKTLKSQNHINVLAINKEIIDDELDKILNDQVVMPRQNLTAMFHLMVGRGIDSYRKYLIGKLNQMGPNGEECWRRIIDETERWEEGKSGEYGQKRYPRTLEEATELYIKD